MMFSSTFHQTKLIHRSFHTSSPRHVHPLAWIFLKPVMKLSAWFTGRVTREWYRNLPSEKQSIFREHLRRNKYRYLGLFGTIGTSITIHYYNHLETVPITGRQRYVLLKKEKLQWFFEITRDGEAENHLHDVLPADSNETKFVAYVAKKIINSNLDMPEIRAIKWSIRVVSSGKDNVQVLPTGDIYVFAPYLKRIKNEHQLAIILAHEMAHAILGHTVEKLSYAQLIDKFTIFVAFFIGSILPSEGMSFFFYYIFGKFMKFSTELPYSRQIENEADMVGLMFAARACYDIRESVSFWQQLHDADTNHLPEYLSTHPSHLSRVQSLQQLLPWALDLRTQCNCLPLPAIIEPSVSISKDQTNKSAIEQAKP